MESVTFTYNINVATYNIRLYRRYILRLTRYDRLADYGWYGYLVSRLLLQC